jgi:hypothetical protein
MQKLVVNKYKEITVCYCVQDGLLRNLSERYYERTDVSVMSLVCIASVPVVIICYILVGIYTVVIRNICEIGAAGEGGVWKEEQAGGDAKQDRRDSGRSNNANLGNEIRVCINKNMSLFILLFIVLMLKEKYTV